MGLTAKAGGKDYELVPAGLHHARCFAVIDMGVHDTGFQDEYGVDQTAMKVQFSFELLGEETLRDDGKPHVISAEFTNSLHEKSKLRPFLESWRGKPFTPEELDGFELANVLGKYCTIQIMHGTSKKGKDFAYVNNALPLSLKKEDYPEAVNENLAFNLDDPDMAVFDKLPRWTQEKIKDSHTWSQLEADADKAAGKGKITSVKEDQKEDVVIEDIGDEPINLDDIPF